MKAIVVREHGPAHLLRIEDLPDPRPGLGEVLVGTRVAGMNYPDLLVVEGRYQRLPPLPFTPGKELAGVVLAVGEGVTSCEPGDRVMALVEHGAWAEQVVVPEAQCFVMPRSLSFEEAAAMGLAYQTAWFALTDRAGMERGETVLVTGASGGVGLACVQVAAAMGASVIAGIANPDRAGLVRASGAAHVVDLAALDLRDSLSRQVHELTRGRGVDVVLDPVGGDVFDAALRALAWRGRLVVIGFAAGRIPEVRANYLLLKNICVTGLQVSDYRDRDPIWMRRAQAELFAMVEDRRLHPVIAEVLPLAHAGEGLSRFRQRGMAGKLVLAMPG